MEEERRKPDMPTWFYRIGQSGLLLFCASLLSIIVFLGKGWLENWVSNLSAQNVAMNNRLMAIEENTRDQPLIRDHVNILWKRAGMP